MSAKTRVDLKQESFTTEWWKDLLQEKIVTKTQLKPRGKELLLMGGAYGHMAHPFDDKDLTFGDLKKIITDGLGGQLNREDNVTEKLDGQNIMISWKNDKLIAARNKGHIKNHGANALSVSGIKNMFAGRGDIEKAFVYAMRDLQKAVGSLSDAQKNKILADAYSLDEEFFDFLRTMQACRDTFGDTEMSMVIAPGQVCEKFFGELNSDN